MILNPAWRFPFDLRIESSMVFYCLRTNGRLKSLTILPSEKPMAFEMLDNDDDLGPPEK